MPAITSTSSYPSLCFSSPLPRRRISASPLIQFKLPLLPKNKDNLVYRYGNPKTLILVCRASEAESPQTKEEEEEEAYEEYEVELDQPYGLKFVKGRDGGTYIDAIAPGGSADKTSMFTVGDRVLATSAVFGEEIWPAAEYGRTMYTIRQRIGPLLMKMQKRYGLFLT